jgi:hypothetical protein
MPAHFLKKHFWVEYRFEDRLFDPPFAGVLVWAAAIGAAACVAIAAEVETWRFGLFIIDISNNPVVDRVRS